MSINFTTGIRNAMAAAGRHRTRLAVEVALLAGAGALSGLAAMRIPAFREALHSAGFGRQVSPSLPGSHFAIAGAPKTYVLLYTSPACRFSVASAPFHREVLETARAAGLPVYLAVERSSDAAEYARAGEFPGARFIPGSALPVKPEATPTILFVHDHLVERAWNGLQQTDSQRNQVLDTIAAAKIHGD